MSQRSDGGRGPGRGDIARVRCISFHDVGMRTPFSDCRRLAPFCESTVA